MSTTSVRPSREHLLSQENITLAARILCCPDCQSQLTAELVCTSCRRSLYPGPEGIIPAMPTGMQTELHDTEQIRNVIDTSGPGSYGENIVLYEQAFHDHQADYYDRLFADPLPLSAYYKHLVREQIYSCVQNREFVVDLCCGTGKSSLPLIERGLHVVGVDVSRKMLELYRRKCPSDKLLLVHADASRPPLRRASCQALIMIGGLHHIQDREGFVQSCCNALGPDGLLIYHEPLKTGSSTPASRFVENLYALLDPERVSRAIRRRLGLAVRVPIAAEELADFTPYERPFSSIEELGELMPATMRTETLRSQGVLSFRTFPPNLQGTVGRSLASAVIWLDQFLGKRHPDWSGDALFAAFRKVRN